MEENKPEEYVSFEQKSGLSDYGDGLGRGVYGMFISMLRIPTLFRKLINRQSILSEEFKDAEAGGVKFGGLIGGVTDAGILIYSAGRAGKGDYTSLAFLAATNLVSLGVELNRLPKSKREHLEMKARLKDKKLRENLEDKTQTPQDIKIQDERTGAGGIA